MNWAKECTPSVYTCCIRIMICLLKTPLHLQARYFNHQHQKSNSSESSQTWGFWHSCYPGNRNIKINGCFLQKQKYYTFCRVLLLKHRKSLRVPCSKIMFSSHFWVLMFWVRRKEEKKKISLSPHFFHCFREVLLVKFNKKQFNLLEYIKATWHFCEWSNQGRNKNRTKVIHSASAYMPEKS